MPASRRNGSPGKRAPRIHTKNDAPGFGASFCIFFTFFRQQPADLCRQLVRVHRLVDAALEQQAGYSERPEIQSHLHVLVAHGQPSGPVADERLQVRPRRLHEQLFNLLAPLGIQQPADQRAIFHRQ